MQEIVFNELPASVRTRWVQLCRNSAGSGVLHFQPLLEASRRRIFRVVGLVVGPLIFAALYGLSSNGLELDPLVLAVALLSIAGSSWLLLAFLYQLLWPTTPWVPGDYLLPGGLVQARSGLLVYHPSSEFVSSRVTIYKVNKAQTGADLVFQFQHGVLGANTPNDSAANQLLSRWQTTTSEFLQRMARGDLQGAESMNPFVPCIVGGRWRSEVPEQGGPFVVAVPQGARVARFVVPALLGLLAVGLLYSVSEQSRLMRENEFNEGIQRARRARQP